MISLDLLVAALPGFTCRLSAIWGPCCLLLSYWGRLARRLHWTPLIAVAQPPARAYCRFRTALLSRGVVARPAA